MLGGQKVKRQVPSVGKSQADKTVLMLTEVIFLADYLDVVQPTILSVDPAPLR